MDDNIPYCQPNLMGSVQKKVSRVVQGQPGQEIRTFKKKYNKTRKVIQSENSFRVSISSIESLCRAYVARDTWPSQPSRFWLLWPIFIYYIERKITICWNVVLSSSILDPDVLIPIKFVIHCPTGQSKLRNVTLSRQNGSDCHNYSIFIMLKKIISICL